MTDDTTPEPGAPAPATDWQVRLLGGLRRQGRWTMRPRTTAVTLVGGVALDLREAVLEGDELVLTLGTVVGGVDVTVPPHVGVRTESVRLFGSQRVDPAPGPTSVTLVIRVFTLVGGLRVRRE